MYLLPQMWVCLGVQLAVDPSPAGEVQLPYLLQAFHVHVESTKGVDVIVVMN